MESDNYKPNSHKSKEEQQNKAPAEERKKLEKVVTGTATVKQKKGVSKWAEVFISEDVANVKNYVLKDVLAPAIKKAVSDIVREGIDMLLYGGNGRGDKRRSTASKISYRNYYDSKDDYRDRDRYRDEPRSRSGYDYGEIIIDTRGEAEEVLTRMEELIDSYGIASVADLYDLVGTTGQYTDNKYGWTSLRSAEVIRVRDGYKLKLPRALPLD